jgi:hypothetical protein
MTVRVARGERGLGIIIVSLLIAIISSVLLFVGTFAVLAVSPAELWAHPVRTLHAVGEMDLGTAQLHVTLLCTTFVVLFLLAVAVLVVHVVKKGDQDLKEWLENVLNVSFYVTFLVFLGNGIWYVYHLFTNFNTLF